MAKKLKVDAVLCDLRNVQEETLAAYESIKINTMALVQNERAKALLARYDAKLNCVMTVECDEEVQACMINGKTVITGSNAPTGKQFLIVNGKATITPDAGDALRQYIGLSVNGKVYCPESLSALVSGKATINGKLITYPNDAIVLSGSAKIDRTFVLRAQSRLYWAENALILTDPQLDAAALAAKGVRFAAVRAVLTESTAETLAPLFTEDTELIILPDGAACVDDDLTLTPALLRRYAGGLYVTGDLRISEACAGKLAALPLLRVDGALTLPEALADELYEIPALEADNIRALKGHLIQDKTLLHLDGALLERFPEGVTCSDCVKVLLDPALEPDTIAKKLEFYDCVKVLCTALQYNAVRAVSQDVVKVVRTDLPEDDKKEGDPDTQVISCVKYTM